MATSLAEISRFTSKIINTIEGTNLLFNRIEDFDDRFIRPEYWKIDRFSNLTNTWCRIYTTEDQNVGDDLLSPGFPVNARVGDVQYEKYEDIVIFGVNITLNKSPKVIETQVKGLSGPVFQSYTNDSFDITINFIESGPTFWQQNSKQLAQLVKILDKPQTLYISNPQLNLIYKFNRVVVKNYNIGQNNKYYNQTPISIKLKSDVSEDILELNK